MKSFLSIFASFLLLINGLSAIYGGWNLMSDPSGDSMQMPSNWLQHSPFTDYFFPGICLFVFNGLGSIAVFVAIMLKPRKLAWLIIAQGVVLSGWIVVQVIMLKLVHPLHFIYGTIGIALIILGRQIIQAGFGTLSVRNQSE